MKALPFVIPKTSETFMVQVDRQAYFYDILHRHPEIQLTLILKGEGTIFAGDYIGSFEPGDIFLIGHNMPHVFKSEEEYYSNPDMESHAVSLFFEEQAWLADFIKLPETMQLKSFLQKSNGGFRTGGDEKDKHLAKMIQRLPEIHGMERLLLSLTVLHELSSSQQIQPLSGYSDPHVLTENEGQRMNNIYQFTLKEFHRPVSIDEVAGIAHLSANAFCRYFKKRTRKTYVNFLNEIRIGKAGKMLLQSDESITNICHQCGFNNLSNFNRIFKRMKGQTPGEYRKMRSL